MNFLSHFEISQQTHKSSYSMHSAHSHSYYELFYLVDGECNIFINNKTYRIGKGTLLIIPINVLHKTSYLESNSHERIYIEFTLDYASDIIEAIGLKQFRQKLYNNFFTVPIEIAPKIQEFFNNIQIVHNSDSIYSHCSEKLYFQQLLITILTKLPVVSEQSEIFNTTTVQIADNDIQNAMNYIKANHTKELTLAEVASYVHLNPSYFSKKFKSVNGFGFKDYLNTVRINHSEKLLLEINKSITDIAFECGYDNSNYFGDAFKHLNKVSPSTFRKLKGNITN